MWRPRRRARCPCPASATLSRKNTGRPTAPRLHERKRGMNAFKQTIIWTALPNGKTNDGHLQLSVFVRPRLERNPDTGVPHLYTGTTTLGKFPDFLSWPERARATQFTVK